MKRVFSMLLVVVLLFGMIPVVQAEEPQAAADNSDVTIEGANSFGQLLAQDIAHKQADDAQSAMEYPEGYNVLDLAIEGNTATVEYDTMEDANLVVAIYTEDGMQQLCSGSTLVTADSRQATVTITGQMPQHFMASAYLLDTYDYSPLCAAYSTPIYTKEFQELLSSTIDSYDADKVLKLGDSTTNFAVYAPNTIAIDYEEGVNTLVSIDNDSATYVIENANERFTSLQPGDVFVYTYSDTDMLIAKIAAITVEDTTATITGGELEMNEVFSHMKLEATADTSDAVVEEGTSSAGVRYKGPSRPTRAPQQVVAQSYELALESSGFTIAGKLDLTVDADFSYYIAEFRQWMKLKLDCGLHLEAEFSVELLTPFEAKLDALNVYLLGGVVVLGMHPGFELSAKINGHIQADIAFGVGFYVEHSLTGWKVRNLSTRPSFTPSVAAEGVVSFTFFLEPELGLAGGFIAEATMRFKAGVELSASMCEDFGSLDDPLERHDCTACIDGDLTVKLSAELALQFLKAEFLKFTTELMTLDVPIGSFYLCFCHSSGLHSGKCPHWSYRTVFRVLDPKGEIAPNATVTIGELELTTDSRGLAVCYLSESIHLATVVCGDLEKAFYVPVEGAAKKVLDMQEGAIRSDFENLGNSTDALIPAGTNVVAAGTCGDQGRNIVWALYGNGLLHLKGSGAMHWSTTPWDSYRGQIRYVKVDNGITSLTGESFQHCPNLTHVQFPIHLGSWYFYNCPNVQVIHYTKGSTSVMTDYNANQTYRLEYSCRDSLKTVVFDEGITNIASYLLHGASALETVQLPSTVKSIGDRAFQDCTSLKNIALPSGLESVGDESFSGCRSIEDPGNPSSLTSVGYSAFNGCSSIKSLGALSKLTSIGEWAFFGCSSLQSFTLSPQLTELPRGCFYGCTSLTEIVIPESVTQMASAYYPSWASFGDCTGLRSVTLPAHLSTEAFYGCRNVTTVRYTKGTTGILPGYGYDQTDRLEAASASSIQAVILDEGVTAIGSNTFRGLTALESIRFPSTLIDIDGDVFNGCIALHELLFTGSAPQFNPYALIGLTANAYYPQDDSSWASVLTQTYGGSITWVPYSPGVAAARGPAVRAVTGGSYDESVFDTPAYKGATFTGLVPGHQYTVLMLASLTAEAPLSADNLVYITQCAAADDGTISVQYVLPEDAATPFAVACGASDKNLQDAAISLPFMYADGSMQVVEPTVVYDGKTLSDGRDYTIVGTVDYTEGGTYTCYIRGIYDYTGLVECTYTVASEKPQFAGVNVVLDAVLGVNFTAPAGLKAEISVGDAVQTVTSAGGIYTVSIFAQDMLKPITARLYSADGQLLDTKDFSLSEYVSSIQGMEESPETKALATATLTYCQYAAKLKGNYSGALNALEAIPENAFDAHPFPGGSTPGVSIHTYLEEACQLRMRVRSADYTVTVDGSEAEPIQDSSTWLYTTAPLLPQDYDEAHTFTVKQDGSELYSGSFSVLTYLGKCLESNLGTADQQNLMRAMYHYYAAAQTYQDAA